MKRLAEVVKKQADELFVVRLRPKSNMQNVKSLAQFTEIVVEFRDIFVEVLPDSLPPRQDFDFKH